MQEGLLTTFTLLQQTTMAGETQMPLRSPIPVHHPERQQEVCALQEVPEPPPSGRGDADAARAIDMERILESFILIVQWN
jgi:hypothetical protein